VSDHARTPTPAGGLFSTARDVSQLYRAMLNGGELDGRRVLTPGTAKLITTTQTGDMKMGFTEGMSWGFGFQVVRDPQGATASLSPGTFGHGGAYATQSWADPVRGLVFVLMIQRPGLQPNGDGSELRAAFQQAAVQVFAK
jgi:CubicO group peptidase (beta-lactamase class C family)